MRDKTVVMMYDAVAMDSNASELRVWMGRWWGLMDTALGDVVVSSHCRSDSGTSLDGKADALGTKLLMERATDIERAVYEQFEGSTGTDYRGSE